MNDILDTVTESDSSNTSKTLLIATTAIVAAVVAGAAWGVKKFRGRKTSDVNTPTLVVKN